jgi:hypothetical protein
MSILPNFAIVEALSMALSRSKHLSIASNDWLRILMSGEFV